MFATGLTFRCRCQDVCGLWQLRAPRLTSHLTYPILTITAVELDYRGMPSDPTKFFQGQNDDERRFSDAVSYAAVLGVLWLLFRAYQELNNLTQ